jgi:hypothetical protein
MTAKKPGAKRSAKRPPATGRARTVESALEVAITRWWAGFGFPADRSDRELRALGNEALELLLDCVDGTAKVSIEQDFTSFRDYGDWRVAGLCAFAKADPPRMLAKVKGRGWDDERIGSLLGAVPDPCFLPYVISRLGNASYVERAAAVNHLAAHRDPRATEALLRALKDRAGFVRFCAVQCLGAAGDVRAIEGLERFAKEMGGSKRNAYLAEVAKSAIERIQRSR